MNKPDLRISDDYATLSFKGGSFYYGYEPVNENDEWCFEATYNYKTTRISFSELACEDMFNVVDCFMIGIGRVLANQINRG